MLSKMGFVYEIKIRSINIVFRGFVPRKQDKLK